MINPKVSVIVPVYNAEKYLRRCLESLCHQTLKEIEIICVNDASNDESLAILKDYALYYPNIKIIDRNVNGGESAARNDGIRAARGEYLSFVDNDDWIDEEFLEKLYSVAKREDADIAKADVRIVGYDGLDCAPGWRGLNQKITTTGDKFFFAVYWWTGIYRRSLIQENAIFLPKGMPLGGDIVFLNLAVRVANRVAVADGVFYHWIRREDSGDSRYLSHEKIVSVARAYELVLQGKNEAFFGKQTTASYFFVYGMFLSGFLDAAQKTDDLKDKELLSESLYAQFFNCRDTDCLMRNYTTGLPSLDCALLNKDYENVKGIVKDRALPMKLRAETMKLRVKMLRRQIKRKVM